MRKLDELVPFNAPRLEQIEGSVLVDESRVFMDESRVLVDKVMLRGR
jgi:hypothetical protein